MNPTNEPKTYHKHHSPSVVNGKYFSLDIQDMFAFDHPTLVYQSKQVEACEKCILTKQISDVFESKIKKN